MVLHTLDPDIWFSSLNIVQVSRHCDFLCLWTYLSAQPRGERKIDYHQGKVGRECMDQQGL